MFMPEGDTPLKHQYYKTGREKKQIGKLIKAPKPLKNACGGYKDFGVRI